MQSKKAEVVKEVKKDWRKEGLTGSAKRIQKELVEVCTHAARLSASARLCDHLTHAGWRVCVERDAGELGSADELLSWSQR